MKKRIQKMNLFSKTFLFMLSLFALIILLVHFSIYLFLPHFYLNDVKDDLNRQLEELSEVIESLDQETCEKIMENHAKKNQVNILVKGAHGQQLYQGMDFQIVFDEMDDSEFQISNLENVESVVVRSKNVVNAEHQSLQLQISRGIQPGKEAIHTTFALLPFTAALAILISIIFAWLYSKWLTLPIQKMVTVTHEMKNLNPNAYFRVDSSDEIGTLLTQLNQVYEKLWQTIDSLEKEKATIAEMERGKVDFLRSASHELKTPLTGLRLLLENMQLGVGKYKNHEVYLTEAIDKVDQLNEMVKQILASSSLQQAANDARIEWIDVEQEVRKIYEPYDLIARSKDLQVMIQIEKSFACHMDRLQFQKIISNLISNAVYYCDESGTVKIISQAGQLLIINTCTPLNEQQIKQVFEPFYRLSSSSIAYAKGSGLGLYFVKQLLDANHLTYSFEACSEGMCFKIVFDESELV